MRWPSTFVIKGNRRARMRLAKFFKATKFEIKECFLMGFFWTILRTRPMCGFRNRLSKTRFNWIEVICPILWRPCLTWWEAASCHRRRWKSVCVCFLIANTQQSHEARLERKTKKSLHFQTAEEVFIYNNLLVSNIVRNENMLAHKTNLLLLSSCAPSANRKKGRLKRRRSFLHKDFHPP